MFGLAGDTGSPDFIPVVFDAAEPESASARMRRTEVRPILSLRAISALLTRVRCSFRISIDLMAAVAGRPKRFPLGGHKRARRGHAPGGPRVQTEQTRRATPPLHVQ